MTRVARQSHKRSTNTDYKICRCNSTCYKLLSRRARDRHYHAADATTLLPSDGGNDSYSDSELGDNSDIGLKKIDDQLLDEGQQDNMSNPSVDQDNINSQTSGTKQSDLEDLPVDASAASIAVEHLNEFGFWESDEANEEISRSLPEIEACLATWLGLGQEKDLFNIRA